MSRSRSRSPRSHRDKLEKHRRHRDRDRDRRSRSRRRSSRRHRSGSRDDRRRKDDRRSTDRATQPSTPTTRPRTEYEPKQSKQKGHYHVICGRDLTPRYKILSLMGEGTFAKVVEVWDRHSQSRAAVKIVRNIDRYTEDAEDELEILRSLSNKDPHDEYPFVKVKECFNVGRHMCMSFPKLGMSLLDFVQKHNTLPIPIISHIARQTLQVLSFLYTHRRMHTDLKLENILFADPDCATNMVKANNGNSYPRDYRIRVIDFGGCTDERHKDSSIVSTRQYRAPEVLLQTGWMYGADVWSTGCILAEIYTGSLLFDTHKNLEHLAMMEARLGRIPDCITRHNTHRVRKYFKENKLRWPENARSGRSEDRVRRTRPVEEICEDDDFVDLLKKMLKYDKRERITAREALQHPFITKYADLSQHDLNGESMWYDRRWERSMSHSK